MRESSDLNRIVLARFLFAFASQSQAVIMGWKAYSLTNDPLYLGFIGLAEAVPALAFALVAGYWVDKGNPLQIYRLVLGVTLLSASLIVAITSEFFGLKDGHQLSWIYLAAFVAGIARAFAGPSLYSLIPRFVPRSNFGRSSALMITVFHVGAIIGPGLGGITYGMWGASTAAFINGVALIIGILALLTLKYIHIPNPSSRREPIWQNLTSGVRYVFSNQMLFSALSLDMFAVLFGGATALLPIFASDIFHLGPLGLGILRASQPFGAFVVSLYLVNHPIKKNAGVILLGAVAGFGVCMICFGLSRSFLLSILLLASAGALDGISMVLRATIVQLCSPQEMRGRIAAVNSFFIASSNEIGSFESGVAAHLLGTVPSVIFGGCMTLLCVLFVALRAPLLRKMDLNELD